MHVCTRLVGIHRLCNVRVCVREMRDHFAEGGSEK